jgi:hypothetical protein
MEEARNTYRAAVGKPDGKSPLRRTRRKVKKVTVVPVLNELNTTIRLKAYGRADV